MTSEPAPEGERLLVFRVSDREFAMPAGPVREIARLPPVARVPHGPDGLLGLANLAGTAMPILSLAALLHLPESGGNRVIVTDLGEDVGLVVEAVSQFSGDGAPSVPRLDIGALVRSKMPARVQGTRRMESFAPLLDVTEQSSLIHLVTFALGNQEFGLPLACVEEVLKLPDAIAALPHADGLVVGSAAVHGAVLPILSLPLLLALPAGPATARARIVVVRLGQHRVGLVVDAMHAILAVGESEIDPVPHVLSRGNAEARIQAICRLDGGRRLVSILAAEHLLRDDITQRLLQSSSQDEAEMENHSVARAEEQFLVCRIGEDDFGLPIQAVEEVAALPAKLTPLPKAPPFVKGVMNLRGQIIPVIDQTRRFGGLAADGGKRRVIVLRIGELQAGFIVDAVSEVLTVASADLAPAPDLGSEETRVFERVANLSDAQRIILIVSPRELLDRAEQDLLRSLGANGSREAS
jgi:purine-binding chemotaxis protein CheW